MLCTLPTCSQNQDGNEDIGDEGLTTLTALPVDTYTCNAQGEISNVQAGPEKEA